ncbi:MAG TPA: hypothetical protein VGQ42_13015 [Candidatus Dormibacteraeota bacterium]|nr:hypothetical protein [Candidatus Dormibacteraeota bacterium]
MKYTNTLMGVAGAVAACLLAVTSAAASGPTDVVGAELQNAQDIANATLGFSAANITCGPSAYGGAVVQDTNVIVAQVFPEDFGAGHVPCVSLQSGASYTLSATVRIEYWTGSKWVSTGCQSTSWSWSTAGAADAAPVATCIYHPPSVLLGTYHRAHLIATAMGATFNAYSPAIWYMAP